MYVRVRCGSMAGETGCAQVTDGTWAVEDDITVDLWIIGSGLDYHVRVSFTNSNSVRLC